MPEYTNGSPVPTSLDAWKNITISPADLAFAEYIKQSSKATQEQYKTYREYYDGDHDTQLTDRMREFLEIGTKAEAEFNLNFIPVPVDVLSERLTVSGFSVVGEDADESNESTQAGTDGILWQWWQDNQMDAQQGDNHTAAIRDADSYVIVEWDNEKQRPSINHELAFDGTYGVHIIYREDKAREIKYALKLWRVESGDNSHVRRMNAYTPDAIYKLHMGGLGWEPFIEIDDQGNPLPWPLPWVDRDGEPLGVPVVHFPYNPGGSFFGKSELKDLIPPQNALNKCVIDELAAADVAGFNWPWLTGDTIGDDVAIGPGRLLFAENPEAKFGSIPATDLTGLSALVEKYVQRMAQISRIPLSYFQVTGAIASADTQKADDTGLISKAEKAAVRFGNGWESVMSMARKLHNVFGDGPELDEMMIQTQWASFERVDKQEADKKTAETQEIKARTFDLLVLNNPRTDRFQLAKLAGYSDDEAAVLDETDTTTGDITQ